MITDRFTGRGHKRVLLRAVRDQYLLRDLPGAADELVDAIEVIGVPAGDVLIEQNEADNDLFLILAGSFSIIVNGRPVAERAAQQHVGEMAVIDPKSRRAASVIALEESVVAKVAEPEFSAIADHYPELWRRIACELGDRLRQRNALVRQRNLVPRIFIGSSKELLPVAKQLRKCLLADPAPVVSVWADGVFGPSDYTIEALARAAGESDFAVLVFGAEDKVTSRHRNQMAPRDNVVLELGIFLGALGRERVFVVLGEGTDIKIPTDLLGVTLLRYPEGKPRGLADRLRPACAALRDVIAQRGMR